MLTRGYGFLCDPCHLYSEALFPKVVATKVTLDVGETNKPQTRKEREAMTDWSSFPTAVKAEVWETEQLDIHDPNALWHSKFTGQAIHHPRDTEGNSAWTEYLIDPAFTTAKFIENRVAGLKKTSTAQCRTVTHR